MNADGFLFVSSYCKCNKNQYNAKQQNVSDTIHFKFALLPNY